MLHKHNILQASEVTIILIAELKQPTRDRAVKQEQSLSTP
jgi:hypothetical protein